MILDCPSCAKRFKIGDDALGVDGRKVKCSACGHVWHQPGLQEPAPAPVTEPDAVLAPIEPEPEPEPESDIAPELASTMASLDADGAMPDLMGTRIDVDMRPLAARRPAPAHRTGWLAVAAMVAVLVAGAFFGRQHIIAQWPQARVLYAAAGLEAADPGEGLEIRAISSERVRVDGVETLVIEGEIVNRSDDLKPVPPMRIVLRDVDSRDLINWTFSPSDAKLLPNEIVSFRAARSDPPAEAADAALSFAAADIVSDS